VSVAEISALNHRLLGLERCFLSPRGYSLPDHPLRRHVIFAPPASDLYAQTQFAGVTDSFARYASAKGTEEKTLWRKNLNQELTAIRLALETAIDWLR